MLASIHWIDLSTRHEIGVFPASRTLRLLIPKLILDAETVL